MSENHQIAIVGGGVVGMTMAMILAERGNTVTVIEKGVAGQGTSANTFAWANGTAKIDSEAYHRLNALGVHFHNELADTHGSDKTGFHRSEAMEWADPTDPQALESLRHRYSMLSSWDYDVSWVGARELQERESAIAFHPEAEGLVAHVDGWLEVRRWLNFSRRRLETFGGTVLEQTEVGELVYSSDDQVVGVTAGSQTVNCSQVIVAAGIDTPAVLATLTGHEAFATRFPLSRAPGLLVRAPATEAVSGLRHVIYTSALPGHFHVRPHTDKRILIGADDTDGEVSDLPDEEQIRASASTLLNRTAEMIPGFEGDALLDQCTWGIGIRPVPADGQSLAGRMPGSDQVWIVVTHSGITLCPAIANLIGDTLDTGVVPEQLRPFDPSRLL